jgi:hypothetical protein
LKTVIILSGVKYHSTKQRPQHMAVYFAKKGYRVIYIGLPEEEVILDIDEFNLITTDRILDSYSKQTDEGIYILKRILNSNKEENAGLDELLEKLERHFTPEKVTFIVAFPDWVKYLNRVTSRCKLIYDCIDDWESFVTDLDWGYQQEFIHNERKIAGIADLVITSAKSLYLKMAHFNNNVYYLPNGVWNADYKKRKIYNKKPKDMEKIREPIVFFMGAIAGWVDTNLIKYIAEKRPEYSFVFVGSEVKQKLPKRSNIYFLGHKKYEELPSYLQQAKVAIIPFKINKLTAAVTPLKFYEYLSSGTPVVTTMMPDLLELKGSKVATNYQQFLNYIDEFINMGDMQYLEIKKEALSTSLDYDWEILLEPVSRYIDYNEVINISTNEFVHNTIQVYKKYKENILIQNELIQLYNFIGEYNKSLEIILNIPSLNIDGFELDYNQVALAHLKNGNYEIAKSLVLQNIETKKQYRLLKKYYNSLINSNNILILEILILKLCGKHIEALKKIENFKNKDSPILLGILSGLYMDIGEYSVAFNYAIAALNNSCNLNINEILDPYVISALINECIKENNFDLAERLAFSLLNVDEELDKQAYDILGNIYLMKYSRETLS